jgi:hypothetical protein
LSTFFIELPSGKKEKSQMAGKNLNRVGVKDALSLPGGALMFINGEWLARLAG